MLWALAEDLKGVADRRSECFIVDVRSGQKGGDAVGKTKRGKGTKIMAIADRSGLPIALCIASASLHEVSSLNTSSMPASSKKHLSD